MDRLDAPRGTFALARYPAHPRDPLRAWDAADEMLLRHLAEREDDGLDLGGPLAILNDGWGALAAGLGEHRPTSVSDSYLARRATAANLEANDIDAAAVALIESVDALPGRVDVAVIKVPKTLALLEHQLHLLAPRLHEGATVVAAAMTKHVHRSTLELFDRLVGPTRTSRAVRKARLVLPERNPALVAGPSPWPRTFRLDPGGATVVGHAGVFSARKLDVGTRLLLAHLPAPGDHRRVVDLGCGTGVVGLTIAARDPEAHVTFVDESSLAVASAEATFRTNLGGERKARFVVGNGLGDLASGPPLTEVDLVVVNPPFHQDHAVGDATAWQMFCEARAVLRPRGDLWVVGNRHLAYNAKLTKLFGRSEVVGSNPGFVVLRAGRP